MMRITDSERNAIAGVAFAPSSQRKCDSVAQEKFDCHLRALSLRAEP
jgi:hypothetical protein